MRPPPPRGQKIWTDVIATTTKQAPARNAVTHVSAGKEGVSVNKPSQGTLFERVLEKLMGLKKRPPATAPGKHPGLRRYQLDYQARSGGAVNA